MGQRLLRAKQKIAHAGIPYRVPDEADLPARLDGVLAVVYLVFTQGYAGGAAPELADEAVRLGRLLVELAPGEDEARGLLALMLAQHARRHARLRDGELVTLEEQDRSLWDRDAIAEAEALRPRPGGPLRAPGRARAHPPPGGARRGHRLAPDRRAVRRAAPAPAVAGGRPQPGGRASAWRPAPTPGWRRSTAVDLRRAAPGATPSAPTCSQRAGRTAEAVVQLDRALALAPTEQERRQLARRRAELEPDQTSVCRTHVPASLLEGAGPAVGPARGDLSHAHTHRPYCRRRRGTRRRAAPSRPSASRAAPRQAPAAKQARAAVGTVAFVQAVPKVALTVTVDGEEVEAGVEEGSVVGPLDLAEGSHEVTFSDGTAGHRRDRRRHRRPDQRRRRAPPGRGRWHAGRDRLLPGRAPRSSPARRGCCSRTPRPPRPPTSWSTARPSSRTSRTASSARPTSPRAPTRSRCCPPG